MLNAAHLYYSVCNRYLGNFARRARHVEAPETAGRGSGRPSRVDLRGGMEEYAGQMKGRRYLRAAGSL